MFQRILVVLEDAQSQHCVFNTALRFAKANHARLCLVDFAKDQSLTETEVRSLATTAMSFGLHVEISELLNQTTQALIETAENWFADLIVIAHALPAHFSPVLPCTVLIVQQDNGIAGTAGTISMTMQLKSQAPDLAVRNRLERLLELTPKIPS